MIPDSMNPRQMAENILELQRQIKEAGSELPTPGVGDTGKILKVGSDGYELANEYSYTPPAYSSTAEVNTGQKWIDGKDIYVKVLSGTLPEITSTSNQSISGLDSGLTLVDIDGYFDVGTGPSSVLHFTVRYNAEDGTIKVGSVQTTYSRAAYTFIVRYTKPDVSPSVVPSDTRSSAKIDLSEPAEEIADEPIDEVKTTRKRSTSSK